MDCSVVVPCYNESGNLANLAEAFRVAVGHRSNIEVILVDNGSLDDSPDRLRQLCSSHAYPFLRTTRVPFNRGYGFGILSGLAVARGDFLAWTHADLQTDPKDVFLGLDAIRKAPDPTRTLVRGVRSGRPLLDVAFTQGMGYLASLALGTRLFDINAQPKLFHRTFLNQLGAAPYDFSLDLYVLYLAKKLGMKSIEIPVHFGLRRAGEAKGGGTLHGKWKLTKRTFKYIFELRRQVRNAPANTKRFDPSVFATPASKAAA